MVAIKWLDCIIELGLVEVTAELSFGLMAVLIKAISSVGESVAAMSINAVSAEGNITVLGTWTLSGEGLVKLYSGKDVTSVDFTIDEEVFKMETVSTGTSENSGDGV